MPRNVPPGAADGGRVDVDGVDFGVVYGRGERGADRARAATQVNDDDAGPGEGPRGVRGDGIPPDERTRGVRGDGIPPDERTRGVRGDGIPPDEKKSLLDEVLGAAARYEDTGI